MFNTGFVTKFNDNKVIVMPSGSCLLASNNYFASWYLDEDLIPVIIIDSPVAKAYNTCKLDLEFTFQHEIDEAWLAQELAEKAGRSADSMYKYYTGLNAIAERELGAFGGEAHDQLADSFPGGKKLFNHQADMEYDIAYGTNLSRRK